MCIRDRYRYLELFVFVFLAGAAITAIFSAMVFRDRIATGMELSWKEGGMRKARDRISSAFRQKEKELTWDKPRKGPESRRVRPERKRRK
jgi:hypothetical protein